jgi:hypothetical protein
MLEQEQKIMALVQMLFDEIKAAGHDLEVYEGCEGFSCFISNGQISIYGGNGMKQLIERGREFD